MNRLIIVEVRPGVFLRMTRDEAARHGFSEHIPNKAAKPKAKQAKKTKKTTQGDEEETGS